MKLSSYLPSGQFSVIVFSIAIAGGLILAAQYITLPHVAPAYVSTADQPAPADDWQAQLDAIQAQAPQLPDTPSQATEQQLLDGAKTENLTDTVARSLLVKFSSASSQGLGTDIPTQDQLINEAAQQIQSQPSAKTYTKDDLRVVDENAAADHAYGNAVMEVLNRHSTANSVTVLAAVSKALDSSNAQDLSVLTSIAAEYNGIAKDLAAVKVPQTLVPLHLQILNDIAAIPQSLSDAQVVIKDPLRGLKGLQQYQVLLGEVGRVFTSVAGILNKNGILFDKSEPGTAWNVFLSS